MCSEAARVVRVALVVRCVSLAAASGARSVPTGCVNVGSAPGLIDAVTAGCKRFAIGNDASIDLAQLPDNAASSEDAVIQIPDGVTLESGRSPDILGGLLYTSKDVQK